DPVGGPASAAHPRGGARASLLERDHPCEHSAASHGARSVRRGELLHRAGAHATPPAQVRVRFVTVHCSPFTVHSCMLWIKALHIIFVVTWFAGLFYLPRLFVYHAMAEDAPSRERFKVMERKLYYGIMTPGAVLTVVFGLWLWLGYGFTGGWLHAKLALVTVLIAYHVWCGKLLADFRRNRNKRSHVWYRWFNEVPTVILF